MRGTWLVMALVLVAWPMAGAADGRWVPPEAKETNARSRPAKSHAPESDPDIGDIRPQLSPALRALLDIAGVANHDTIDVAVSKIERALAADEQAIASARASASLGYADIKITLEQTEKDRVTATRLADEIREQQRVIEEATMWPDALKVLQAAPARATRAVKQAAAERKQALAQLAKTRRLLKVGKTKIEVPSPDDMVAKPIPKWLTKLVLTPFASKQPLEPVATRSPLTTLAPLPAHRTVTRGNVRASLETWATVRDDRVRAERNVTDVQSELSSAQAEQARVRADIADSRTKLAAQAPAFAQASDTIRISVDQAKRALGDLAKVYPKLVDHVVHRVWINGVDVLLKELAKASPQQRAIKEYAKWWIERTDPQRVFTELPKLAEYLMSEHAVPVDTDAINRWYMLSEQVASDINKEVFGAADPVYHLPQPFRRIAGEIEAVTKADQDP